MRSKVILVSIILAGALTLSACGDAGQKEKKEEPKRTESTADAETGKEDGNGQKPFTGVSWSEEEDEKYAAYEGKTGMCVDYDNGGVYYVNWSGDKYLYYWKNGKNKLILNKWVSQIAYMDGKVYCIYDKSGKTYQKGVYPSYEGVIAEIDVKTGKYIELTERTAHLLTITRDGIYYKWVTGPDAEEQRVENGFYSFQDKKIHEIEERLDNAVSQTRFGKYAIVARVKGEDVEHFVIDLETKEEKGIIETVPGESIGFSYRMEDKLFFRSGPENSEEWAWWSLDMTTGEKRKIEENAGQTRVCNFVRFGDLLYAVTNTSGEIATYDEEGDELKIFTVTDINGNPSKDIMGNFKTDGKYLYTSGERNNDMMVLEVRKDGVYEIWSSLLAGNGKGKKK